MSAINNNLKSIFIHIAKCGGTSLSSFEWNKGNGHKTYLDFDKDLENIQEYFVWSFVRNPWARTVSAFEDCPELHQFVPDFEAYVNILYKHKSIFDKNSISENMGLIPEIPIGRIHFWPAHLCLKNKNGELKADFVGKLENIESDFEKVCKKLKVNFVVPPKRNKREGKKGRKNSFYKDLYNDSLINKVGEIYKKDIEIFNYNY